MGNTKRFASGRTFFALVAVLSGGWPTFTFFVKVGTTRLAAWAGSCDAEGVVKQ
jgi:hypothetical protein